LCTPPGQDIIRFLEKKSQSGQEGEKYDKKPLGDEHRRRADTTKSAALNKCRLHDVSSHVQLFGICCINCPHRLGECNLILMSINGMYEYDIGPMAG